MFGNYPFWTKPVKSDLSFVPAATAASAIQPSVWVPNALVTDVGIYVRMGTYFNYHYNYHPYQVPNHYPVTVTGNPLKNNQYIEVVSTNDKNNSNVGEVCELSRKSRRVRHNKIKYRIYRNDTNCYQQSAQKEQCATRDLISADSIDFTDTTTLCDTVDVVEFYEKEDICGRKDIIQLHSQIPSQPKKKWLKNFMNGNLNSYIY